MANKKKNKWINSVRFEKLSFINTLLEQLYREKNELQNFISSGNHNKTNLDFLQQLNRVEKIIKNLKTGVLSKVINTDKAYNKLLSKISKLSPKYEMEEQTDTEVGYFGDTEDKSW